MVDQLAAQIGSDVAAARVDRRRGADVRLRSHPEIVGGLGDPDAGGPGERPVRADPYEHRYLRAQFAEDDLVLRLEQATRGVEHDRGGVVTVLGRLLQLMADVVL